MIEQIICLDWQSGIISLPYLLSRWVIKADMRSFRCNQRHALWTCGPNASGASGISMVWKLIIFPQTRGVSAWLATRRGYDFLQGFESLTRCVCSKSDPTVTRHLSCQNCKCALLPVSLEKYERMPFHAWNYEIIEIYTSIVKAQ